MRNPFLKSYTADFNVPPGFTSLDLIFSSDFGGTLNGVAYSGATDTSQSFDGNGDLLGGIKVVVSAGTVRLAAV